MSLDGFSVIMSVYRNDELVHFRRAVDSIIRQTVVPSEVILIVDGAVPDGILDVVNEFRSKYRFFRPIFLPENRGLGNALKLGVEHANYDLIARMDSDDISVSDRFERQLVFFEQDKQLSVIGGNISEFIGEETNVIGQRVVPTNHSDITSYLRRRCPFNHVTVMFRKSAVLEAGNYIDWFWNEDYYLWVRMYKAGCRFRNIDATLVNVRVGPDMYRRRGGWKYFRSEAALQRYMFQNRVIRLDEYLFNIVVRFVLQVITPGSVRGFVFRRFFRV